MKLSSNSLCPCKSNKKYKKCCKLFHEGTNPSTALELMKSRFSAYALSKTDYIIKSTHPNNKEYNTNKSIWAQEILFFCENTQFENLDILEFVDGDFESFVTFKATLKQNDNDVSFIEKSRFLKIENNWLYVDGEFL